MRQTLHLVFLFSLLVNTLSAQQDDVWFEPNRGQWDSRILYRVPLQMGDFFIEKDKFTYALSDLGEVYHAAHEGEEVENIQHHTVFSHFLNSSWQGEFTESDSSTFYKNYFLGQNADKWASKVRSYQKVELKEYYPDIDLILEATDDYIKYSFRVHPGGDPSQIKIFHEGAESIVVNDGQVEINTRFGPVIENGLKVWEEIDGQKRKGVAAKYQAAGDTVSFYFPNDYDENEVLMIDPNLTFSSFTGSTSDNWGFTAAPDKDGNLYGGGIVFGSGYPITPGAYSSSWAGGQGPYRIDMGISKFSADGADLIYSTYIGGNGNETPNSIITNELGELYILGTTSSSNFPLSANAYQSVFNGGQMTTQIAIQFNGTDITVSKLSADGSSLMASTYLGGDKNDGLNISTLNYNYGDVFRGEIILDNNGDVVITSSTQSTNFPVVNASNSTLGGNQDAIVTKFSPDLSTVIWSTYLGGSGDDAGYSLQVAPNNNLFVTGGTKSSGLPFSGGHQSTFQGGSSDGFIAEINGNTSAVVRGTYVGTSSYDQTFFVQLDSSGKVYVFGQTTGNMEISPGVYSNANSGQFLRQYSADLSTLNWSTRVGGGNGVVEISPTAFLVSNCNEIYFTGWGGQVNHSVQASGSTTVGFPTTPDAYQSSTNGNNFYIGVLSENASALKYGTFMGGVNSSFNHVDGGTSRFDKKGSIYHSVCAACQGNPNGFTSTPGAYSTTNNSSNCNMAVWKFDLGAIESSLSLMEPIICLPDSVKFINNSQNGSLYHWDFGDGQTSNAFEPTHFYPNTGTYEVMLVVTDIEGCFDSDTSYVTVEISDFDGGIVEPVGLTCPGIPYQLEASGGVSYEWSPAEFLDDSTSATPMATIVETTTFTVVVSDVCGSDTLSVTLSVGDLTADISEDIEICKGDTIQLSASGGGTYQWSSNNALNFLSDTTSETVTVAPEVSTTFFVEITTAEGCELTESVYVSVISDLPQPILADTANICQGESIAITTSGANDISWSPNNNIQPQTGGNVTISAGQDTWYFVDYTNVCGTVRDSIFVHVVQTNAQAGNDTIVCPGDIVELWASGGETYSWFPANKVANPTASNTTSSPTSSTIYTVLVTDENGCIDSAKVYVECFPNPTVSVTPTDYYGFVGDEVQFYATGSSPNGSYVWTPEKYLSCDSCRNPIAYPPVSKNYTVEFTDENGCKATNDVRIHFEGIIYVPNTFTPNSDEFNNEFLVVGGNIREFEIIIFNRWGEIVYESKDISVGWDGTYAGQYAKDGTYVWKIKYTDTENNQKELVGHVNLLR
ncbi:MAG TPA: gliding motility-associated C-terminal domain-containing protein [Brumimicrobium sp.]|nr:gliding motility-associated C-terminal domain-containing protein [Brumimicrobium sp.]